MTEARRLKLGSRDAILRFQRSERLLHWAVAIPFMVCYTTALILVFVYNPNPARPLRALVSWTHRLSGVCLFLIPLLTIAKHRRDAGLHAHNIWQVWTWTVDDLKWIFLIGPASFSKKISLPHQGKFNAGEKINFMMLTATYPVYLLTGLMIWFGDVSYASWLVHFSLAATATPLLIGHILMATVNPDTRVGLEGMLSGYVDREWASHHYHWWYQEHYGRRGRPSAPVVEVERRLPRPARSRGASSRCNHPAPSWGRVQGCLLGAALSGCPRCRARAAAAPARAARRGVPWVCRALEIDGAVAAPGGEADASATP